MQRLGERERPRRPSSWDPISSPSEDRGGGSSPVWSRGGSELLPQGGGPSEVWGAQLRKRPRSNSLWPRLVVLAGRLRLECTLQCPLSPLSSGGARWPWPERARPGARKGLPEASGPRQGQVVGGIDSIKLWAPPPTSDHCPHPRPRTRAHLLSVLHLPARLPRLRAFALATRPA